MGNFKQERAIVGSRVIFLLCFCLLILNFSGEGKPTRAIDAADSQAHGLSSAPAASDGLILIIQEYRFTPNTFPVKSTGFLSDPDLKVNSDNHLTVLRILTSERFRPLRKPVPAIFLHYLFYPEEAGEKPLLG